MLRLPISALVCVCKRSAKRRIQSQSQRDQTNQEEDEEEGSDWSALM